MSSQPYIFGRHHRQQPTGVPSCCYDILVEGVEYRCDDIQLAQLYRGIPLDELDLIRLDEVDDD
jgi:hypothetical protein